MGVNVRRRNGKWYVYVHSGGQRKARCIGYSRQVAEEVRSKIEARLAAGEFGFDLAEEKPQHTFSSYSSCWLQQFAEIELKRSTVLRHKQILRTYIHPRFGNVQLDQIKRDEIKSFLTEYAIAGKLSRNSIRLIYCTLRSVLSHAVEDELLLKNPASRLGRFTRNGIAKRQARAMTREQAEQFLNGVRSSCSDFYPFFLCALRTGMRRGELIALQWGDITFGIDENDSDRFILVSHNYVRGEFTNPKSKKSRRVDLSRQLRAELLRLRGKRLEADSSAAIESIAEELVFPSNAGTPLSGDNVYHRHFLPALEAAKLPRFRFHDLRHTFGSLLIQDGASLAYVKEQLGHSSIQVTVDTYGHLIAGADISWIDRLDSPAPTSRKKGPRTSHAPEADIVAEPDILTPTSDTRRN